MPDLLNGAVALGVTIGIVDLLEAVHVHHDAVNVLLLRGVDAVQTVVHVLAPKQAGQLIGIAAQAAGLAVHKHKGDSYRQPAKGHTVECALQQRAHRTGDHEVVHREKLHRNAIALGLMHLPHALGVIAEQQQIQQNVQRAPMVSVVRRNGKDPPRAKKVCHQQHQKRQQRRTQQQVPSAQASNAAVDPEVHIQTPRIAHAHGSAGADGVGQVQPEPACRAGHAVQQKADRLCCLCQQRHHQYPAKQRCSNAVFTFAAHPQ